jgi:2-keto-4-pentenoate hydratase/2-oxohepta-3-ene-1,7-dioic acid hydratase in catechol pathway
MSGVRPSPLSAPIPVGSVRMLAPVDRPPSVRDFYAFEGHVLNAAVGRGLTVDPGWYERPCFYFSNPAAIVGPNDSVAAPADSAELDYELEVACVIGTEASDLDPADPATMDVIAGFTILNDFSARDLQRREVVQKLGPTKGKDFATAIGPWLATRDCFDGVRDGRPRARMQARVNGAEWSTGELSDIYFSWTEILAHASADTRLVPGDVIGSGTCGWGCILERSLNGQGAPYRWLQPGDTIELEVEHLGVLRNSITTRDRRPVRRQPPATTESTSATFV